MSARRTLARFLAAAVALVAISIAPARAELTFPAFTNYVVDQAEVIPAADESALAAKLKAFQERTGRQLAVATVPSLQGTSVEDFGNRLFRAWKLGDATRNDGALLLVAPTERKVRIEVGYGLEGDLTDAVSRLIIENAILPRFKAGDVPGGIARGTDDIMAVFSGQAEDYKALAAQREGAQEPPAIVMAVFLLLFLYVFIRGLRSGGVGRRRASPWIMGGPGFGGSGGGWSGGGGFSGGGGGSSGGGGASGGW